MKLGKAFSDSVVSQRHKVSRDVNEESRLWWLGMGRILMFLTFFSIAFFVLIWRLFDLTVIQGHRMRALADGNRTRELLRRAPRGLLLDRTGKPLVANEPYYRLLKPCEVGSNDDCTAAISIQEGEQLTAEGLPAGTFLELDYHRQYIDPSAFSHMLGYTGEITDKELKDEFYQLHQYHAGDRVGRTGAEAVFEDVLRGRDGRELVEVDATGTILRTLGRDHEIAGTDVILSIDAGIQNVAVASFPVGEKGAIVVSKPSTGEILALYSSPSFDVNAFSMGLSDSAYDALVNDTDQPMFDRAIGGVYPPGSTFKIVTSLAALEEGAITSDTTVEDVGVLTIGPFRFPNWYFQQYGKTEGLVDIVKAIGRSNDIFFYKTGEWLGITKLVSWAHRVGLGKPLGIELPGEAGGLMPDPGWKKEHFDSEADKIARNDEWYLGDTYHISIGQGYLLTTPLQVNVWTNLIAYHGIVCRPTIRKSQNKLCKDLALQNQTIELITKGMQKACETGGTGWPLFNFSVPSSVIPASEPESNENADGSRVNARDDKVQIPIACKTGTAEFGDPKNKTHAWFTAFAPIEDPEISVTVLVEGAGEGSSVAAPIAKAIFEEWFGR